MRRFLRSPLFFIAVFTAVFLVASIFLYFDSPEDPGRSLHENSVLTRITDMATGEGDFLQPASCRCKNRESRPAFAFSLPEALSADVMIPENARLEFGIGLKEHWAVSEEEALAYVVRAGGDGEQKVLFQETIALSELKKGWKSRTVDCSAFSSQRARLSFSFEKIGFGNTPDKASLTIFLSCPMFFGGRIKEYEGSVIFYLIDTMRADHLSCYGYDRRTSTHMDNLAGDGVLFRSLYAQASWTGPSVATMFTSLYPSDHGFVDREDRLSDRPETLAETLSSAGYFTKGLVANGFVTAGYNFHQGFDSYMSYPGREQAGHARAEEMVALANAWLEKNHDKKFFLYVHTVDPHSPYDPPEPFRKNFQRGFRARVTAGNEESSYKHAKSLEEDDIEYIRDLYDGEIAYSDHCFGHLIKKLKALGLYDDTLIVLLSDHGEEFWEHGSWGHGKNLFQEQLHIPLIIKFPGNRGAGTVVKRRILELDIMPTLLAAFDLPIPRGVEGQALYSAIFGAGKINQRKIYSETKKAEHRLYALLDERYKYILRKEPVVLEELYDIRRDPLERKNLISKNEAVKDRYRLEVEDYLSHRARGYHFLFPAGNDEDRVTIRIQGIEAIRWVDFLGFPGGQRESQKVMYEGGAVRICFKGLRNGREVIFLPGEEKPLSIEIEKNGAILAGDAIRLGEKKQSPKGVPFLVENRKVEGRISLDGRPERRGEEMAVCYIWAKNPEKDKAAPTEDSIQILKALGYIQ